jgi:hypothetical protein
MFVAEGENMQQLMDDRRLNKDMFIVTDTALCIRFKTLGGGRLKIMFTTQDTLI